MIRQNIDKFIEKFKEKYPGKDVVSGFNPEKDIEGINYDKNSGNIKIDFDAKGMDSFFGAFDRDVLSLTQQEVAEILSDEPSQEPTTTTTTQKPATFDKSKLDAKTLKALEDNIKANPGASEEEVAKAMKLI